MVATSIAALIVFIVFCVYMGWIYLVPVAQLAVNGIVLYAIYLRSEAEIVKEKKFDYYLGGATFGMVIYVLAGNFLEGLLVWGPTAYIIIAFICAQIGIAGNFLHKKYKK
jgi:hypothetical protein